MLRSIRTLGGALLEVGREFEDWVERELEEEGGRGASELEEGARASARFHTDQVLQFIESDEYELMQCGDGREALEPLCDRYLSLCFKLDHQNEQISLLAGELRASLSDLRSWTADRAHRSPERLKELRIRIANLRLDVSEQKEKRRHSNMQRQELHQQLVGHITEARLTHYLKRLDAKQVEFPAGMPPGGGAHQPLPEAAGGLVGIGCGKVHTHAKDESAAASSRAKQLRRRRQRNNIVSDEELTALLSES